jgi:hypothetical protein
MTVSSPIYTITLHIIRLPMIQLLRHLEVNLFPKFHFKGSFAFQDLFLQQCASLFLLTSSVAPVLMFTAEISCKDRSTRNRLWKCVYYRDRGLLINVPVEYAGEKMGATVHPPRLRNVDNHLRDYVMSQSRKPQFKCLLR